MSSRFVPELATAALRKICHVPPLVRPADEHHLEVFLSSDDAFIEARTSHDPGGRGEKFPFSLVASFGQRETLMRMKTSHAAISKRSTTPPPNESLQMFLGTLIGVVTLRQILAYVRQRIAVFSLPHEDAAAFHLLRSSPGFAGGSVAAVGRGAVAR